MYSDFTTVRPLEYTPRCGGGMAPSQGSVCLLVGLAVAFVLLSSSATPYCGYLPRLGGHVTAMVAQATQAAAAAVGGAPANVAHVGPAHAAGDEAERDARAAELRAHVAHGPCVVLVFAHWCPHCKGAKADLHAHAAKHPDVRFVAVNGEALAPEALAQVLGRAVEYYPTILASHGDGAADEAPSFEAAIEAASAAPAAPAAEATAAQVALLGEEDDAAGDFMARLF
jgi:thiol-disulfide isomerase/thioredoxin